MSKYHFTKAYDHRGASMGRSNIILSEDIESTVKAYLQPVYLDSGAYDKGGAYWGFGQPLYVCFFDGINEGNEMFVRAWSREDAKKEIREFYPNLNFHK